MDQIKALREAVELLGIRFCAHCGKPHVDGQHTCIALERPDGAGPVHVCMEPTAGKCFFATVNAATPVTYKNLYLSIAQWVMRAQAYAHGHPINGVIQEFITGLDDDALHAFAVELLLARGWRVGGVTGGETGRDLLRMCGWIPADAEFDGLLATCRGRAAGHKASK